MGRTKQIKMFRQEKLFFGGSGTRGNPNRARPFSKKCDTHIVLKSRYAVGSHSFLRAANRKMVKQIIEKSAKRFYVTLRRNINVGNHLHLLIHSPSAEMQRNFLRTVTALIARKILNANKGSPATIRQFWDGRPFSRLVPWGRAYQAILNYLSLNSLEAIEFTKVTARAYLATVSTE
jgi:REP element-mobilizing transposase RayT